MSERLPVPRSGTIERVFDAMSGGPLAEGVTLTLEIVTSDQDLRLRDIASFFTVIDSAFGRLDAAGYLSYAHRPDDQLSVSAIRTGSTRYEIAVLILDYLQAWQTLVTYAVVVVLPSIVSGRAARNWAEAYRAYEEGHTVREARSEMVRLSRRQRSVVREVIRSDPLLRDLSKDDRDRVARAVEHVIAMEGSDAAKAARFSREHVRSVALTVSGSDQLDDYA